MNAGAGRSVGPCERFGSGMIAAMHLGILTNEIRRASLPEADQHDTAQLMHIKPDQIDPDAAKVVQRLRRFDHTAYLVGGCVRDLLLGRKPKDFDVATSATPNEIRRLFR